MTATASAILDIRLNVDGAGQLTALAKQFSALSAAAQRGARGAVAAVGASVAQTGNAAGVTRGKLRTLEQELDRLSRMDAQRRITAQAREMLNGPPGPPKIVGKLRTVEGEMRRLQLLERNRAVTAQARGVLGMGPSILAGHGFVHRGRQTLGLMRDMAVAGMGIRFAFQSAAAGIGATINPIREFEKGLAAVKTKGGFSDSEMAEIAKTVRTSGRTSVFGARESTSAAIELAAAGLEAPAIAAQLPTVMQFAQAGDIGTEEASSALIETMAQFGLDASSFERIGNSLVKGANMSTVAVADMTEAFKMVAPVASDAGMQVEDLSAMVAILGERGIKGTLAGTGLRRMMINLADPSKNARKALARVGLSAKDAKEGLTDLPAFLIKLEGATKKLDTASRQELLGKLFGARAITAASVLMKTMTDNTEDGISTWQRYQKGISEADGEMRKTAETMGKTLDGRIRRLKASTEDMALSVGKALVPALEVLLPKLGSIALGISDWASRNSELTSSLAVAAAGVGGTTFVMNGLLSAAGLLDKLPTKLTGVATAAGSTFGGTFAAAVIAGVAGYAIGTKLRGILEEQIGMSMEDVGATVHRITQKELAPQQSKRSIQDQAGPRVYADGDNGNALPPEVEARGGAAAFAITESLGAAFPWMRALAESLDRFTEKGEIKVRLEGGSGGTLPTGQNVSP